MKVIVLGSGTSTGVPVVGRNTPVNLSDQPKDRRSRASIYIEDDIPIIVDTGPDFRMQILTHRIEDVGHVLYTHSHYDHIGGLDDLRPLCFKNPDGITCYSDEYTHKQITDRFNYFYSEDDYFEKPKIHFQLLPVDKNGLFSSFQIGKTLIQPVKLMHIPSKSYGSVGYVFNNKMAYLTDLREIFSEYMDFLYNLDLVIVGSPLPYPHPNHLSIYEAVDLIKKLKARQGLITHLADQKFHHELINEFPGHIQPAYDGITVKI